MKRNLQTMQTSNISDSASGFGHIWRTNPTPCEAQLELNRIFESGYIDRTSTPEQVRALYSIFQRYSAKVFAAHFRATKAIYGWNTRINDNYGGDQRNIPELGIENKVPVSELLGPSSSSGGVTQNSTHDNSPFFTWMYTDHDKKCDCVVVALPIISGSRDINFSLAEDGCSVTITYKWPVALYRPIELFKDLGKSHPKVHSFISHMLNSEITEKSNPEGSVTIALPCRVKREIDSYTKTAVKSNETKIVVLEFESYQKSKIVDDADNSISFE